MTRSLNNEERDLKKKVSGEIPESQEKPETDPGNPIRISLSRTQRKVFLLLSAEDQKYSGAQIVNKLNLKKSSVYDSLKRLSSLGLILEEKTYPKSYILTRAGRKQVSGFLVGYDDKSGIFADRSHHWRFKVDVEKFPDYLTEGWASWNMKNWIQSQKFFFVNGLEVEVRKNAERSLTLSFNDIVDQDPQVTEDRAFHVAYKTLDLLKEEAPGISFGPVVFLNCTVVHHTAVGDPFAVECAKARITIKDPVVSVDASRGPPETEFDGVHPGLNRERLLTYHKLIKDVVLEKVDPWKTQEGVKALDRSLGELSPEINRLSEELSRHLFLVDVLGGAGERLERASETLTSALGELTSGVLRLPGEEESPIPKTLLPEVTLDLSGGGWRRSK